MQMETQLCYIVVIVVLWFQILVPKSSAAKTFGIFNNLQGFLGGKFPEQTQHHHTLNKSSSVDDPERVVKMVQRSINDSRRQLSYVNCGTGNPIDDCWRCDLNWQLDRQRLADCVLGFDRGALGGKNGRYCSNSKNLFLLL